LAIFFSQEEDTEEVDEAAADVVADVDELVDDDVVADCVAGIDDVVAVGSVGVVVVVICLDCPFRLLFRSLSFSI